MDEYIDEKLIKAQNAYKAQAYGDIYNGLFVKEELMQFDKLSLFSDKIQIYLPVSFEDMPENLAKLKYPMSNRPQVIKTNKESDVNFNFNIILQVVAAKNRKNFTMQMKKVIRNIQPSNVFYELKYINGKGQCKDNLYDDEDSIDDRPIISFFDYKSPAIDQQLYNFVLFVFLEDCVIHGAFNCCYKDAEIWKPIFVQITNSIRKGGTE